MIIIMISMRHDNDYKNHDHYPDNKDHDHNNNDNNKDHDQYHNNNTMARRVGGGTRNSLSLEELLQWIRWRLLDRQRR